MMRDDMHQRSFPIACLLAGLMALLCPAPRAVLADVSEEYAELESTITRLNKSGKSAEAKPLAKRLIAWAEGSYGDEPRTVALAYWKLGTACKNLFEYAEAERNYEIALAGLRKHFGPMVAHREIARLLEHLGEVYQNRARYEDATIALQQSLAMYQKLDPQGADIGDALYALGELYRVRDMFAEAEPLMRRAADLCQKLHGPDHLFIGKCMHELGVIAKRTGRYEEAERHFRRSIEIHLKAGAAARPLAANNYNSLAGVYAAQGRFAEADACYRWALQVYEALPVRVPAEDSTLGNLAALLVTQGRYEEAEGMFRRVLAIRTSRLGPDHPFVGTTLNDLGNVLFDRGQRQEAEALYRRALANIRKANGEDHADVAEVMLNLASLCRQEKRFAEAEEFCTRAVEVHQRLRDQQPRLLGNALRTRANLYQDMERLGDARADVERAISILERAGVGPDTRSGSYVTRAEIAWKQNRREAALADLQRALALIEEARLQASGGEQERAVYLARFSEEFETLLAWQLELNDTEGAFKTLERRRARTLLDEMSRERVDLLAGRSREEKQRLRDQRQELQGRIAALEREVGVALGAATPNGAELDRLGAALGETRRRLYELYRDERSTNPLYRKITKEASSPTITEFREKCVSKNGLALLYQLGEKASYVLVVDAREARFVPLALDENAAKTLGTTAGPLTFERVKEIVIGKEQQPGVAKQLATDPRKMRQEERLLLTQRLAALWPILLPEAQRKALVAGGVEQLVILPDGPLALLPFETLVLEAADNPEYLLDRGPPILYGPSASVLYNLALRPAAEPTKPYHLVSVADPAYASVGEAAPLGRDPLAAGTTRSRYAGIGGGFERLPFTKAESKAVVDAYKAAGREAAVLQDRFATEAYVRHYVAGRKVIHLACHGVTDQAYGNFFGALALTPGPKAGSDPTDDGFLTMPEIYELNLKGCELAILSACETNFGPQQQGEGTWALSRGFLIAGARRVIASNWVVDDAAAASLIGHYASLLAVEKPDQPLDHARELQAAKRAIREQDRWHSPYYWSAFVLIGPK
jgi:CHAT domain-containing protein/Flp pilus assembly protein TadD